MPIKKYTKINTIRKNSSIIVVLSLNAIYDPKKMHVVLFLECRQRLGMASGAIRDDQISASLFDETYRPEQARFHGRSAWCVSAKNGPGAFLEVDLGDIKRVTWLGIQGFGDGYISNFTVQYKRVKTEKYWRNLVERLPFNTSHITVRASSLALIYD